MQELKRVLHMVLAASTNAQEIAVSVLSTRPEVQPDPKADESTPVFLPIGLFAVLTLGAVLIVLKLTTILISLAPSSIRP